MVTLHHLVVLAMLYKIGRPHFKKILSIGQVVDDELSSMTSKFGASFSLSKNLYKNTRGLGFAKSHSCWLTDSCPRAQAIK
jgi:hypothetical protein